MFFMVIETFKNVDAIHERFEARGRMLPEGVTYQTSWIEPSTNRCFQVMEAPTRESLQPWIDRWADLMEFEVVQVLASADFWARQAMA